VRADSKIFPEFDGIICFGGVDWWYHNRGHYDLQMMRELSRDYPILYVNSIGMRPPRVGEGAMFLTRVKRKLKSLFRGLVRVRENFTVYSPVTLPGGGQNPLSAWIAKLVLSIQVKFAAYRSGIKRPLVWVACPPGEMIVDHLKPARLVYQRTDRFEDFAGVDPVRIKGFDTRLKEKSDIVLFCSRELYEAEKSQNSGSLFVDHGVDFEHFRKAGLEFENNRKGPADLAEISFPRVGFIGGIDAHTFDPDLFVKVAAALPDVSFVMIGACSLPEGWCPHKNVFLLGQRPYEQVADYMAACDLLIMPWNQSDWIKACNPVKMKEYLAVGRPIVSTYFPEVEYFRDHIDVATDAQSFAEKIQKGLSEPGDALDRRRRVEDHTWSAKAQLVADKIS